MILEPGNECVRSHNQRILLHPSDAEIICKFTMSRTQTGDQRAVISVGCVPTTVADLKSSPQCADYRLCNHKRPSQCRHSLVSDILCCNSIYSEPELVRPRLEKPMRAMKWTLASVALVISGAINNEIAVGSDSNQVDCMKKPIQSEPPLNDRSDPNYWTKERMKSAKPIEMPTPDQPAPIGQNKTPDSATNKSVIGEGNTGDTNAPSKD